MIASPTGSICPVHESHSAARFLRVLVASALAALSLSAVQSSPGVAPHVSLRDDVGRLVSLREPPRRIVSLAPSVTETLFALGASGSIVGVTDQCDTPAKARSLPRVGGMIKPDWESILRLRPDLLVATTAGNDATLIAQADDLGLPLYFMDARDLEGLLGSITRLAGLVGRIPAGEAIRSSLGRRIAAMNGSTPPITRRRVLYLVWVDPPIVPGKNTFLGDALRMAGLDSITADAPAGWPTYDLESILRGNPDWIVAARHNAESLRRLANRPGWKDLQAVRANRLVTVSEALERPSPGVVDAMEELRDAIVRRQAPE